MDVLCFSQKMAAQWHGWENSLPRAHMALLYPQVLLLGGLKEHGHNMAKLAEDVCDILLFQESLLFFEETLTFGHGTRDFSCL